LVFTCQFTGNQAFRSNHPYELNRAIPLGLENDSKMTPRPADDSPLTDRAGQANYCSAASCVNWAN
jgi:hypothetical protein